MRKIFVFFILMVASIASADNIPKLFGFGEGAVLFGNEHSGDFTTKKQVDKGLITFSNDVPRDCDVTISGVTQTYHVTKFLTLINIPDETYVEYSCNE